MLRACRGRFTALAAQSLVLSALVTPETASAHAIWEVAATAGTGFLHPLTGLDHLLAMFTVGVWAAQLGRPFVWALPAAFPFAMMFGAVLVQMGVILPAIEPMIGVSVALGGIAVATKLRLPLTLSVLLVGCFAIFHGHAHAIQVPNQGGFLGYTAGFLTATVLLHLVGLAIGMRLAGSRHKGVLQIGGSVIAASGATLLLF